jgi:putative tricarboxylic transport membrane protein
VSANLTEGAGVFARAELWGGLFWLAIGAYVAWAGYDLGLGTLHEPGSGFALFGIGLIMAALSLGVIGPSLVTPSASLSSLWTGTRWPRVLLVIALLLAFGFSFETIGFIPGTVVLLLALMLFVDPVGWPKAWGVAVIAPLVVWFVMTKGLKVQLPAGLLSGWLG